MVMDIRRVQGLESMERDLTLGGPGLRAVVHIAGVFHIVLPCGVP